MINRSHKSQKATHPTTTLTTNMRFGNIVFLAGATGLFCSCLSTAEISSKSSSQALRPGAGLATKTTTAPQDTQYDVIDVGSFRDSPPIGQDRVLQGEDNEELEFEFNFPGYVHRAAKSSVDVNPTVASGLFSVIGVTQVNAAIHLKNGDLVDQVTLKEFFSPVDKSVETEVEIDSVKFHDPKIIYDMFANKFIILALRSVTSSSQSLMYGAYSTTSDPQSLEGDSEDWGYFVIDLTDSVSEESSILLEAILPDHVVDQKTLFITSGMHDMTSKAFVESRIWTLNKEALFAAGADLTVIGLDGSIFGSEFVIDDSPLSPSRQIVIPVDSSEAILTSASRLIVPGEDNRGPYVLGYMADFSLEQLTEPFGVYCVSFEIDAGESDLAVAHVFQLSNVPTTDSGSPTLTSVSIVLGEVDDSTASLSLPDAVQPDSESGEFPLIETHMRRAMDAVWHNEALWFVAPVSLSSDAEERTGIYWAKLSAPSSGLTGATEEVLNSGTIAGQEVSSGAYTFNPSIAINGCDRVGVGYSLSSGMVFPGSYVSFLNDKLDSEFGPAQILFEGQNSYENRKSQGDWAAYSGIAGTLIFKHVFS